MADRMEVEAKVIVTDNSKKNNSGITKSALNDAKEMANSVEEASNSAESLKKSLTTAFNKSAIIGWAKIIKDTVSGMLKASEKQTEYIENLNMMQVAFGKTAEQAESFVNSLSMKIGIDQSGLTRQLGIFRQISDAMGYTSEVADLLSTNLSKLSLDISSLYNVSYERAGKALESAITGQVRSIRTLTGADITLATLQQEALRLGITKTTREMSRAEKTILIYLSLERQLANANGDLSRTVNSVANQTKIFHDQISMLGRQLGSIFIPILKTVLPILNGILMVLNAIVSTILGLFGIKPSQMAKEFGIASGGLDVLEDGLNGVSGASEKAKKGLRGFDKLNNITTPTPTTSSGSGGGGIGGIDTRLLEAIDEYNLHLDEMRNKATEIRDKILEWVGLTLDENGQLKFTGVTIGTIITAIGGAILAFKTIKTIIGVLKKFKIVATLGKILAGINPIIVALGVLAGAFIYAYKTNDDFKKKVDDFVELLRDTFLPLIKSVYEVIKTAIKYFIDILQKLWKDVLVPLWDLLVSLLKPVFETIIDLLSFLFEKVIKPLTPILEWIAKTLLKWLYDGISNIINMIKVVIKVLQWLTDNIITPLFTIVVEGIKRKIEPAIEGMMKIIETVSKAIKDVVDWWNNLTLKDKTANFNVSKGGGGSGSFGGGGGGTRADGGFVRSGDIFIANENNRPEYIGSFGNQTAVANTDQIVDGISMGVTRAMLAVGANREGKVVIEAKGDTKGLLDFITFEQRKKDRQYGL